MLPSTAPVASIDAYIDAYIQYIHPVVPPTHHTCENVNDDVRADERIAAFFDAALDGEATKEATYFYHGEPEWPRTRWHGLIVRVDARGAGPKTLYIEAFRKSGSSDGDVGSIHRYFLWDPLVDTLIDGAILKAEIGRSFLPGNHRCYTIPFLGSADLFAKVALAKAVFKRLCGVRPDARLRVRLCDATWDTFTWKTDLATHDLIRADQAADLGRSVERLRRRAAARVIRDRWRDVLGNPHHPVGNVYLMRGFEAMVADPEYLFEI